MNFEQWLNESLQQSEYVIRTTDLDPNYKFKFLASRVSTAIIRGLKRAWKKSDDWELEIKLNPGYNNFRYSFVLTKGILNVRFRTSDTLYGGMNKPSFVWFKFHEVFINNLPKIDEIFTDGITFEGIEELNKYISLWENKNTAIDLINFNANIGVHNLQQTLSYIKQNIEKYGVSLDDYKTITGI